MDEDRDLRTRPPTVTKWEVLFLAGLTAAMLAATMLWTVNMMG